MVSVATDVEVPDGGARVDAPFVANVWKVDVAEGDVVEEGQGLVSLEAMKMETHLPAPAPGRVVRVLESAGTQVAPGDALVVLEPVA